MIDKISQYFIKQNIISDEDKEVCDYGVFVIGFNLLCMASVFVIGWLLIDLKFSILYLIFYTPIRTLLGGYHSKTPVNCYLLTTSEAIILFMLSDVFINRIIMVVAMVLMFVAIINYLFDEHYWVYKCILTGLVLLYCLLIDRYQLVITYLFFLNSVSYLFVKIKNLITKKTVS